jgi:hypothetical protein
MLNAFGIPRDEWHDDDFGEVKHPSHHHESKRFDFGEVAQNL